jgi:hypothetical protein
MIHIVLALALVCFVLYRATAAAAAATEGFSSDSGTDVDSLVYDKNEYAPTKKNRIIEMLQLPLPLSTFEGPPKNSSDITRKELQYIAGLSKDSHAALAKKGTLGYFIEFAGKNGLLYDNTHLRKVAKDVMTLSYLVKSYYNRPRPYQLGFLYGHNISPVHVARTSSYPCERTLLAKVLALQLSYNNPEYAEKLHAMAKGIELSRYYAGLNYPSDTVASLRIADALRDKMKYLEVELTDAFAAQALA